MKNKTQHDDLVETEIRDGSDRLITSSRTWLKVSDAMSKVVAAVPSDETVVSVAKVMTEKNISCILIEDNGEAVGIITETDLLKRAVVETRDLQNTKVSDIMSFPIESLSPDLSVLEASRIMDNRGVKQLPVLSGDRMIGIVTQTNLIRVLTSYGMWRDVSMIMTQDTLGVQRDATVTEAAKVMADHNVSSIVIMEGDKVLGIFTERDLFKKIIAQQKRPEDVCIEDVMSSPVVTITPDCSIYSASRIMEKQHVRKLVVMEDEHLYGILSQTDIFQAVKRKLHEEEEKNYKLLESSKSNIYTLVPDGKITYINPSFMKLLKVSSPDELVGEYFLPERFWLNSEDREELLKELRSGVVQAKDLNLKNSSGKRVYVTFFSTFTKDACGKIDGIQGVLHDVTDKKELAALRVAEEALRASKQKLKASNEQLKAEICKHKQTEGKLRQTNINLEDSIERANCMTTEALAASKSKSEFLANMSHEIHTPMNAIIGFSDVLAAEDLTNDQKRYINLIQSAGHDLLATIDNILDFARIEAGKLKTEITDYLLSDILGDIDSLLRPAAAAKGLEFKISRCDNLPAQIRTDPVRLRQCLINLIKNAIKFTEEGHIYLNITLEYRDNKDEPYIRFDVEDTGIGIEEEHQQLVLEAFTQADYSVNRKYGGTGLGLAITKQLCELLGGELSFVSQTGEGSVFTLTMPSVADVNETEPKSNAKSVADSNAEHLPH